jgi:hypothetical protein
VTWPATYHLSRIRTFHHDGTELGTGRELFLTLAGTTSKNLEWGSLIIMGDSVTSSDDPGNFPHSEFCFHRLEPNQPVANS